VLDYMTVGSSSYNALQIVYVMRSPKHLTVTGSYTYSKSLDDSSSTSIVNSTDRLNISAQNGLSDFNAAQILNLGYTLKLPTPFSRQRLVRMVFGDWSTSGIYNARTGHPFSGVAGSDESLLGESTEYLNFTPGGYHPLPSNRNRAAKVEQWFNTNDVALNTVPGTFGNVPRNFFIGPAFINTTLSVDRSFNLRPSGGYTLLFRLDAINAFNTPNLGQPSNVLSSDQAKNLSFGQILSTVGNNGVAGTNGRRLQLSGVLRF